MRYETLRVEKRGGADWVTFNRPDRLNTLNHRMIDELLDYFGERTMDHATRVIVLRGAGRAYCAGLDLDDNSGSDKAYELEGGGPAEMLRLQRRISEIVMRMRLTKECLNHSVNAPSLEAAIAMEDRNQVLCLHTQDFKEGVAAFMEKRAPRYTNT